FMLFLCLLGGAHLTLAQQSQNFTDWLNGQIRTAVSAKVNQRSNTNQTEAPSMSGNTTSLLDQSSAPDLFGVALNLAGLSKGTTSANMGGMTGTGSMPDVNSVSVTATAYSLYAALKRVDPLQLIF